MMRDPNYVRNIARVPAKETVSKNVKTVMVRPVPPAPVYEPISTAIRLPNGKIQLVTQ
jgi:hypothetical protein